ncbi:hypothetical protein T11_14107 [Trichinella zimbabwensis]|uniref:Uncharacterized protein n=1 Tax=Trichinella zimbabwensis TaxID=268475 RepID=A0A0V1H3X9_9BILA|nr:hypothetical protein T11_14107 [Trichinella zimbabwensis]
MDLDRSGRCFPHQMIGPTNRTRAGYSKVTVHLHIGNEKSRTRAERPCALVKRRWPPHWQRINSATVKIPSAPSAPPPPTPTPTLPCIKRTLTLQRAVTHANYQQREVAIFNERNSVNPTRFNY